MLDFETTLQTDKQLTNVNGTLNISNADNRINIKGYEIHAGISSGEALKHPALMLEDEKPDGAISCDNQIFATYIHGLFDSPLALQSLLDWSSAKTTQSFNINEQREQQLGRLADAIEDSMNMSKILDVCHS